MSIFTRAISTASATARLARTRPAVALFSSSARAAESYPVIAKPTHPADIVAHAEPGPPTLHETPEVIAAEVISDAPAEMRYRQVRIYKPTKSTMQSGKGKTKQWVLDWDTLSGAGRWENALMGWGSSADYMQATRLAFRTKEDAIAFADKQGWEYQVDKPNVAKIPPKNYASNYLHVPGKVRIHHTK